MNVEMEQAPRLGVGNRPAGAADDGDQAMERRRLLRRWFPPLEFPEDFAEGLADRGRGGVDGFAAAIVPRS